jgi:RHS repeat-associated protein
MECQRGISRHQGIRVAIKQNGEETRFLIDNNQQEYAQVIEEYQPNGTVKTAYVHGWDLISQTNASVTDYYQVDGLGSTRQLTNNTGTIRVEYDYDAYGNLTNKVGDASNNYLFAGEQFDAAVDGYYLRARYYDPATGRFASTDPFEGYNDEPITLPDYFYAGANPVNEIDPSGEAAAIGYGGISSRIALPLLASVRTATLASNVGNVTVRGLPVAIAISCTFLKIASALYLAEQGVLSRSSALDCGFEIDPCEPALAGAVPGKDRNTNIDQFIKIGDEYTAIRDLRLVDRGAIPEPSQDGKSLFINLPGGGVVSVRDEGSGLTLDCRPSGRRPVKIRYTPFPA